VTSPAPRSDGVRVGTAAVAAVVAAVVGWVGLEVWRGSGREYPLLPWLGLVPLLLVAVAVLVSAWQVRRYVKGVGTFRPSPQWARGALVAAQACALGGAVLIGLYAANVLVHLSDLDVPSVRDLAVRAGASAVAALVVLVSGFVAQWWCRLPPEEDEDERGGRDTGGLAYG
jgi:Protein of unknown function (DUF3180)